MTSRAPTNYRRYTDRGVQTDLAVKHCCQTSISQNEAASISVQSRPIYIKAEQQSVARLIYNEPTVSRSAYSHCQQPNSASIAQSQARKQATFTYSQPSGRSSGARIVSLPEIHPTRSGAGVEFKNRVVSLPEHGYHAVSSSDLDDSGSIELGSLSGDSILLSQHGVASRPYPPDLPQTPSPPSSPDSIMIINHEAHLPGSFLRRPYTDADGWITWASSPPRPIPALHGPLSLPYARCPSGAEGTLIEGDDLSNKIWGLGSDDIHLNPRQPGPIQSDFRHIPNADAERRTRPGVRPADAHCPPQQRQRDAVIDISGPPTYVYVQPEPQVTNKRQEQSPLGLSSVYLHTMQDGQPPGTEQSENTQGFNHSMARDHQGRNTRTAVDFSRTSAWPRYSGLGLQWYSQQAVDPRRGSCNTLDENTRHHLSSSAPPFIPASASVDKYLDRANNCGEAIVGAMRISQPGVLGVAQQCRDRQWKAEPGTPSTTSTHWSPKFPYIAASVGAGPLISSDPVIYSPPLDVEDYSIALQTIIQQLQARDALGSPSFKSQNTGVDATCAPTFLQSHHQENIERIHLVPLEYPRPPATQHNPPVVPDGRRSLSDKNPRSIPLARLIQRRLSSVAEEEVDRARTQEPLKFFPLGYPEEQNLSKISQRNQLLGMDHRPLCSATASDSTDETHTTKTSHEIFDGKVVVKFPGKLEMDSLCQDTNLRYSLNVEASRKELKEIGKDSSGVIKNPPGPELRGDAKPRRKVGKPTM